MILFIKVFNLFKKFFFIFKNFNCKISSTIKLYNDGIFHIGKNISIERGCNFRIKKNSILEIKDNVFIGKDVELSSNNNIFLGENTSIQSRANIFGDVKILSNCVIGPNLYVSSFSHEFFKDPPELIFNQDKKTKISKPVLINEDCFIGLNVFIKPGITIGRGCVIGANTNIIKDLDPYSVVVGNPAKLIKKRFNFLAPDNIYSNISSNFPYFYKGFKKNNNSKLYINESFFCLALNLYKKKEIVLEIKSNSDVTLLLINENNQIKINSGSSIINFKIREQKKNFLEFQIKEFSKNLLFEIMSAKSK